MTLILKIFILDINFSLNKSHYDKDRFLRFLGIHVEPGLGWHNHINYVSKKISKGLFMLRVLHNNISVESMLIVYYGPVMCGALLYKVSSKQ